MRVVFSDEAGINNDSDAPNVVVAAVMLNLDNHWPALANDIEEVIKIQGHDPSKFELKGARLIADLRRANNNPSEKAAKFDRESTFIWTGRLLKLFQHGIPIFINAVNKAGYDFVKAHVEHAGNLFKDISAYMAAFSQCLREADDYIHSESPKENLLWISDDAKKHEADLKDALRSIRDVQQFNLKALYPTLDFSEPRFSNTADTIYFGPSKHSRALQLADLCATTAALHLQQEPLVKPFFDLPRPQVKNGFVAPLFLGMDKMRP